MPIKRVKGAVEERIIRPIRDKIVERNEFVADSKQKLSELRDSLDKAIEQATYAGDYDAARQASINVKHAASDAMEPLRRDIARLNRIERKASSAPGIYPPTLTGTELILPAKEKVYSTLQSIIDEADDVVKRIDARPVRDELGRWSEKDMKQFEKDARDLELIETELEIYRKQASNRLRKSPRRRALDIINPFERWIHPHEIEEYEKNRQYILLRSGEILRDQGRVRPTERRGTGPLPFLIRQPPRTAPLTAGFHSGERAMEKESPAGMRDRRGTTDKDLRANARAAVGGKRRRR